MHHLRPEPLSALVGKWVTEATHPLFAGTVKGNAVAEWLEGNHFLILRSHAEHPDAPDSISVIGPATTDASALSMFYFDSRGVHRVYEVGINDRAWTIWRDSPDFSQRFTGAISDDGDTIYGLWELCRDGATWNDDLKITYRRTGDR
jgi:hypothetical protein